MSSSTPTSEALIELKADGFSPEAIEQISHFIADAPLDESGQISRRILDMERDPESGVVRIRSRKISNLIYNWRDFLNAAVKLTGAGFLLHGEPVSAVLLAIEGLRTLSNPCDVQFSELHAEIIRALWADSSPDPVSLDELKTRLQDKVPSSKLEQLLQDLQLLRVIRFDDDRRVRKIETFVLRV